MIRSTTETPTLPRLENGEHLDQPTFHQRYEAMPPGTRAELIGGIVHMPSPVSWDHSSAHDDVGYWLRTYRRATLGTRTGTTPTCIMGVTFEPQPDQALFILEDYGGQSRKRGNYLTGTPELVVEIAFSTGSTDLHEKRQEYERHGVREYVVVALRQGRVIWHTRQDDAFVELAPDEHGVIRSVAFPGLWLDEAALLAEDLERVLAVLQLGLASPEHAAFVAELAGRKNATP